MDLVGVALSGGGVRSATFNLGILQALAEFGLLTRVDYLSTVSGGGYIGAWLASWSKRVRAAHPANGVGTVQARLQTEPLTEPDAVAVRAVRFLREYSNYLTPTTGFFSADTWTMIAIWLRNTILNQAVLVLMLSAILAIPWVLWFFQYLLAPGTSRAVTLNGAACEPDLFRSSPVLMTTATVLLLYASAVAGHQLRRFGVSPLERKRLARDMLGQAGVLWGIELPVLFSAMFFSVSIFDELPCFAGSGLWTNATAQLATVFAASMVLVASGGRYWQFFLADRVSTTLTRVQRSRSIAWGLLVIAAATAITSVAGAAALVGAAETVAGSSLSPAALSFAFVSGGVPAVIVALSLMVVLDIGLLGRNLFDEHREWWSRMGAWLNILSLAWLALCSLALYSPLLVELTNQAAGRFVVSAGGLGWVAWTAAGVVLGREQTPEESAGC